MIIKDSVVVISCDVWLLWM